MLIENLQLTNFLSFCPDAEPLALGPLNVLIGPNGSGKSNVLEALALLKAAPSDLAKAIRASGSPVQDWLWKGGAQPAADMARVRATLNGRSLGRLRYGLGFAAAQQRFELTEEFVEVERPLGLLLTASWLPLYQLADRGVGSLMAGGLSGHSMRTELEPNLSVLAQRRDPTHYPELSQLAQAFGRIRLFREWAFGPGSAVRRPQDAAAPNDFLSEDCGNLGLVLNSFSLAPEVKDKLIDALQTLYDGIDDYVVKVEGGTVQVFLMEGSRPIPATRLSDGTLRFLCLLAILCHPNPPPLVAIEEPELGLHPDVLPTLANMLRSASERTQLVVTTHSEVLVDALTETPEAVIVMERGEGGTQARRLDKDALQPWLERYRLGQLWSRGDLGGNRW